MNADTALDWILATGYNSKDIVAIARCVTEYLRQQGLQ